MLEGCECVCFEALVGPSEVWTGSFYLSDYDCSYECYVEDYTG